MQFTYPDRGEPVAYIDADGDLCIKLVNEPAGTLVLCVDRSGVATNDSWLWNPDAPGVRRVFYPGDSITITF